MPDTITPFDAGAMVVQRRAQRCRQAQNARLAKGRMQTVQRTGQLQHRAHGHGAGVFRFELGRPNHKLTIRARRHIQLVARVHQAHRALQGDAFAFDAQHLTAHPPQMGQSRLAAGAACIHRPVCGMCLVGANDGLRFNMRHHLPLVPGHAQAVQFQRQRVHQLVIGQLAFASQVQAAMKTPGQNRFDLRQCCGIQLLHLRFRAFRQLVVQQAAEVFQRRAVLRMRHDEGAVLPEIHRAGQLRQKLWPQSQRALTQLKHRIVRHCQFGQRRQHGSGGLRRGVQRITALGVEQTHPAARQSQPPGQQATGQAGACNTDVELLHIRSKSCASQETACV